MMSPHSPRLSRRGFCLCCVAAVAGGQGWLTPRQAFAKAGNIVDGFRAEAVRAHITVHPVRGGLSVLEGSGGNIAVMSGADGKVLVDAGITATRSRIEAALASLDNRPVTHLINTHWHFDHADGNEWIGGAGVSILAHANTLRHLRETQRVEDWDFDFPPAPRVALPTEVVDREKTLNLNGTSISLRHLANAHTDGDLMVTFGEADVIHVGDLYWADMYPFIDYSTGGGIDGAIRAADAILAQAGKGTLILPGHGAPVSNADALRAFRDMLAGSRDRVAALKRRGHSMDEVVAARPTAPTDERFGKAVIPPAFFTKLVFEGV
jgi:glyoxylase-like metal-dependent hydrolase (beta-lactamase superfamily II)